MTEKNKKILNLRFDGRIIDHLGLKMYQSPIAATAEIISNSWDADANKVDIILPTNLEVNSEIKISDDGIGMTFEECQDSYLNVGFNRRRISGKKSPKGRKILGRKGIGKFAGFGIAEVIRIDTISKKNGERTIFELDVNNIRSEEYKDEPIRIDVLDYKSPDVNRKKSHGTSVTLKSLNIQRTPYLDVFKKSMSRRFTLLGRGFGFIVIINDEIIPNSEDYKNFQFDFPDTYRDDEKPNKLIKIEEGWGIEELENGKLIKWRIGFYKDTIKEKELRGVSVLANGKICQLPFFFNLEGGLGGQFGQSYMTGQVEADFLDEQDDDLISTERQRIDWNNEVSNELLKWGQDRLKRLLVLWQKRRNEEKNKKIEKKILSFSKRLDNYTPRERKYVESIIKKLAAIPMLTDTEIDNYGNEILNMWDGGRLKSVIEGIREMSVLPKDTIISILYETDILSAINVAESFLTKLDVIVGLNDRVSKKEYENDLRDYIAEHPWLLGPNWQTFKVESGIRSIVMKAIASAKLEELDGFKKGRIDLVLSNKEPPEYKRFHLLELMRPGIKSDFDHLHRFENYVTALKAGLRSNNLLSDDKLLTGYLISDKIDETSQMFLTRLNEIKDRKLYAMDWSTLLKKAIEQYGELLEDLLKSVPEDSRIKALKERLNY